MISLDEDRCPEEIIRGMKLKNVVYAIRTTNAYKKHKEQLLAI